MDGVDVALVETDGEDSLAFGPAGAYPYSDADRASLHVRKADEAAAQSTTVAAADPPTSPSEIRPIASVDPRHLNFDYDVSGPQVPWKPIRAFDDGTHVFIQMPNGMRSSDAPALLVAAGSGSQMVNYRVRGEYYVVDRLFGQAVMVSGVGRQQDRVTIQYAGNAR